MQPDARRADDAATYDLERFVAAQNGIYERALAELQAGHKQSLGQMLVPALAISVAAAAFVYTQYFMEGDEVVAE